MFCGIFHQNFSNKMFEIARQPIGCDYHTQQVSRIGPEYWIACCCEIITRWNMNMSISMSISFLWKFSKAQIKVDRACKHILLGWKVVWNKN